VSEFTTFKDIKNFLLDLTRYQYIRPLLLFSLAGNEPHVIPYFPQNRFGLSLDFFKQHFLSAHALIINGQTRFAFKITLGWQIGGRAAFGRQESGEINDQHKIREQYFAALPVETLGRMRSRKLPF